MSEILWFPPSAVDHQSPSRQAGQLHQPAVDGAARVPASLAASLCAGPGDLWHSGLQRGTAGRWPELRYWSPVYWWYLNDRPEHLEQVSWRVDPTGFGVRREAWDAVGGWDDAFESDLARSLDLGFRLIHAGGVPLHVPELFPTPASADDRDDQIYAEIPAVDLYLFFIRHFKRQYQVYAMIRESLRRRAPLRHWRALKEAERRAKAIPAPRSEPLPPRVLLPLPDPLPRVSVIIPTMRRQDYTAQVLEDLANQTVPPAEILVVDATPAEERQESAYQDAASRLPLQVLWQRSVGSSRARNEAIQAATGEFILFGDDDIRVPPDYVENHLKLLLTYGAAGANGLDIEADDYRHGLPELAAMVSAKADEARQIGVTSAFNNANSCVRRDWVELAIGNDGGYDGGYGEDNDFGQCLAELGAVVLRNPFSHTLHLKPPSGGYRWWGSAFKQKRRQPWELHRRVGWIRPKPSPTILYGFLKHYRPEQVREWVYVYLLRHYWPSYGRPEESRLKRLLLLVPRVLSTPWVLLRMRVAFGFARDLQERGPIYE